MVGVGGDKQLPPPSPLPLLWNEGRDDPLTPRLQHCVAQVENEERLWHRVAIQSEAFPAHAPYLFFVKLLHFTWPPR